MHRHTIIICLCVLNQFISATGNYDEDDTWNDFLLERKSDTSEELEGVKPADEKPLELRNFFVEYKKIHLNKKYRSGHMFRLFGNGYILLDTVLYKMNAGPETYFTKSLYQFTRVLGVVTVVEATEYYGNVFAIVASQHGTMDVHSFENKTKNFVIIQSIDLKSEVTSAKFFVNQNHLYLALATKAKRLFVKSKVYKWTGSYFDMVARGPIAGFGLDNVITFHKNETTEAILMTEYYDEIPNLKVRLFEFTRGKTANGIIGPVYDHAMAMETYEDDGVRYLILFEVTHVALFYYDGDQFHMINQIKPVPDVVKVLSSRIKSYVFIYVATMERFLVYNPKDPDDLHLLGNMTYDRSFKEIKSMYVIKYKSTDHVVIAAVTDEDETVLFEYVILAEFYAQTSAETTELLACINELKSALEPDENNELIKVVPKSKRSAPSSGDIVTDSFTAFSNSSMDHINVTVIRVRTIVNQIKSNVGGIYNAKNQTIYKELVVKGNLSVDEMFANDVNLRTLNEKEWNPNNWLSYSKPQTITGHYVLNEIEANELKSYGSNNPFADMLRLNGDQNLFGNIRTESMEAKEAYVTDINDIPFVSVYLKSKPLKITGRKRFGNLRADYLKLNTLNETSIEDYVKPLNIDNSQKYNIDVEYINDIHWDTFKKNSFQSGKTSTINGNIKMKSLITETLETIELSGRNADDLFTTTTDQEISSDITFSNLHAQNITCNHVNGIDLELEVVTKLANQMNDIDGPVIVKNMGVFGNIHLKKPLTADIDDTQFKPLQIYDSVKIIGDLKVTNFISLPNTSTVIDDKQFNLNGLDDFWMKTKQQTIPNHVELSKGITLPHLITDTLNNIPLNQYMLNDNQDKMPGNFYFENVHVRGNLTTNDNETVQPDLKKIDKDAVRLRGSYTINGRKIYKQTLTVDHLNTTHINDVDVKSLEMSNEKNVSKNRFFKKLVVNGNISTHEAMIENINEINVKDLYKRTIFIDKSQQIKKLNMEYVKVQNLSVERVNGQDLIDYISNLTEVFGVKSLKQVTVEGNLNGTSIISVEKINDIDINMLLNANQNKRSVHFMGPVEINDIVASNINNVDFTDLFDTLFYRNWEQNVTAKHKFKKLYTRNLQAPQINDIKLGKLINIYSENEQEIVSNNVQLINSKFPKSVNAAKLECDISDAIFKLKHPPLKRIKYLNITKNVELWDNTTDLYQLVTNAFHLKKHNIITGSVTFENLYGRDVTTRNTIKDINLQDIADDALYKTKTGKQIVGGHKKFSILKASNAYCEQNVNISIVNGINLQLLNKTIINKNDIDNVAIKGTKTFVEGFETTYLQSVNISGISTDDLVSLDNLKEIPAVTFDKLKIENNLDINYVNDNDFNEFLKNRVLKSTNEMQELNAVYYVNNMQLNGPVNVSTLNNMKFEDIVFDVGVQYIKANKEFADDVDVMGNARVGELNGHNLTATYEESILMNETNHFTNNIEFHEPATLDGSIKTKRINGILIEDVNILLNNTNFELKVNVTQNKLSDIAEIVTGNNAAISNLARQLLYVDYMNYYSLSYTNVIKSYISTSQHELLIHIIDAERNEFCNLTTNCSCLVQHTLQVSPDFSIHPFVNKGVQRVYRHTENERTIVIITNSISSSEFCRSNASATHLEEVTRIMYTGANGTNFENVITTKYVSDVKFFSLNNYTYAVIALYYDSDENTHRTNSMLIRFSQEMDIIEDKKLLPTIGAWSLTLLYTWQGINLVIGSNMNATYYNPDLDVVILRFNETSQNFELMQTVPIIDHIAITGIVLKDDSFLIIADKHRNVHILKYDQVSGNYFRYQTLLLESSIVSLASFNLDSRDGEPYLCVVTERNKFYMYSFKYLEGWKLVLDDHVEGLLSLIPFEINDNVYLFAPSKGVSKLLSVVKQG